MTIVNDDLCVYALGLAIAGFAAGAVALYSSWRAQRRVRLVIEDLSAKISWPDAHE